MKKLMIIMIMICLFCCSNFETVDNIVNSSDTSTMNDDSSVAAVIDNYKDNHKATKEDSTLYTNDTMTITEIDDNIRYIDGDLIIDTTWYSPRIRDLTINGNLEILSDDVHKFKNIICDTIIHHDDWPYALDTTNCEIDTIIIKPF